ncbi:hypothetical protein B0H19DRAFT_1227692 [Mycena capillaripes]|nr:hypothetical protein B0H19DRAFT_1227692 [Mycena capillaripes]
MSVIPHHACRFAKVSQSQEEKTVLRVHYWKALMKFQRSTVLSESSAWVQDSLFQSARLFLVIPSISNSLNEGASRKIVLGFLTSESENLSNTSLASGFNLTDGKVDITAPQVIDRPNHIVVLFGDSGVTCCEGPSGWVVWMLAAGGGHLKIEWQPASLSYGLTVRPRPAGCELSAAAGGPVAGTFSSIWLSAVDCTYRICHETNRKLTGSRELSGDTKKQHRKLELDGHTPPPRPMNANLITCKSLRPSGDDPSASRKTEASEIGLEKGSQVEFKPRLGLWRKDTIGRRGCHGAINRWEYARGLSAIEINIGVAPYTALRVAPEGHRASEVYDEHGSFGGEMEMEMGERDKVLISGTPVSP